MRQLTSFFSRAPGSPPEDSGPRPGLTKTGKTVNAKALKDKDKDKYPVDQVVDKLRTQVKRLDLEVRRLRTVLMSDQATRSRWNELESTLDRARVASSVERAFAAATVDETPMPHLVLRDLWPLDTYAALLEAIPPEMFFPDRDPVKQNLKLSDLDMAPAWTRRVLEFIEGVAIPEILTPTLVSHLRPYLERVHSLEHGPELGARIATLPHVATQGRLMRRRPGYKLEPHFDPQRAVFTCLLYFARPGDDAAYGTQIYSVDGDVVVDRTQTFYPGEHGHTCTLVKTVPFEPNTALVFLNRGGAHAAEIPQDAPTQTERYSYQFYVSPQGGIVDR